MAQLGHKINSWLNGQWGAHGQKEDKRRGNKRRRNWDKNVIKESLEEKQVMKHRGCRS